MRERQSPQLPGICVSLVPPCRSPKARSCCGGDGQMNEQLLEYLQHVHDEVGAIARVRQTVVRHAIRRHHLLRIGDESIQRLMRPGDTATLERRRITKVVTLARPSPEDAAETGPHSVS